MDHGKGRDYKGKQEMEGKESGKSGIVYREASPNSLNEGSAYIGYSG